MRLGLFRSDTKRWVSLPWLSFVRRGGLSHFQPRWKSRAVRLHKSCRLVRWTSTKRVIRESSDCLGTVEVGRSAKVKLIVYHEYRYTKKLNMEIRLSFTVTLQGENISLFIFSIRFFTFFFLFCSFPLSVCSFKFSLLLIYFSACYWIANVNVGEWNKSWAWSVDILGYFRPELTTRHQLTIPTNRESRARVSLIKIMLLLFRGVRTRHAYIEIVYSRRIHRGCLTNAQRR